MRTSKRCNVQILLIRRTRGNSSQISQLFESSGVPSSKPRESSGTTTPNFRQLILLFLCSHVPLYKP